jgi:hypothetical protein
MFSLVKTGLDGHVTVFLRHMNFSLFHLEASFRLFPSPDGGFMAPEIQPVCEHITDGTAHFGVP